MGLYKSTHSKKQWVLCTCCPHIISQSTIVWSIIADCWVFLETHDFSVCFYLVLCFYPFSTGGKKRVKPLRSGFCVQWDCFFWCFFSFLWCIITKNKPFIHSFITSKWGNKISVFDGPTITEVNTKRHRAENDSNLTCVSKSKEHRWDKLINWQHSAPLSLSLKVSLAHPAHRSLSLSLSLSLSPCSQFKQIIIHQIIQHTEIAL